MGSSIRSDPPHRGKTLSPLQTNRQDVHHTEVSLWSLCSSLDTTLSQSVHTEYERGKMKIINALDNKKYKSEPLSCSVFLDCQYYYCITNGAFPLHGRPRPRSVRLGTAWPRWALTGPTHFMLRFHYSLGTGVVTIVTQCRRSRDVIFNENSRKTTQPLAVSTQSSQLLISVQKLDKS